MSFGLNERNDRDRISNGGQVSRDDLESSGHNGVKTKNVHRCQEYITKRDGNFKSTTENLLITHTFSGT